MNTIKLFLLAAALALFCSACNTPESENMAERPWNGQAGGMHGLPSNINQGR